MIIGAHAIVISRDADRARAFFRDVLELARRGVEFTRPVSDEGWGLLTACATPGAGDLALYEPRHPSPVTGRPARVPGEGSN